MENQVNYLSVPEYVNKLAQDAGLSTDIDTVYGKEFELIAIVKNCPFLYDQTHKAFKDFTNREVTWAAIAKVFNVDKDTLKSRWRSLREHYNKNKNTNKEFIQELSFLEPHIRPRRSFAWATGKNDTDGLESDSQQEECNVYEGCDEKAFPDYESVVNFIKLVESRPILYSKTHPSYKNRENNLAAWEEISKQTGYSVNCCRDFWKNLRERFGRDRRQGKTEENKRSKFFKLLMFLHPHVGMRRIPLRPKLSSDYCISNSDSCETKYKNLNSPKIEYYIQDDTQDSSFMLSSSDYEMTGDGLLPENSREGEPDPLTDMNISLSEDDKFGQSIAAELKKISSGKKKLKLKADIYKLLYENADE